ncbi:hypothetical protein JAAARDRAFT_133802 [Jaapia argillacea MUCL 33604]|uniref:Uncharacterized protein n=1 Tax=Jaapia argillacea MUCL 33604 TaxID=933084 RepID=A0A067PYW1_9AGAM|nr:hypothetical protein JAAARDRAFT_133802 [Jaapia argillacea MUCL 33604]
MGHIIPEAVKLLVAEGLITGVQLDPLSKAVFCESCMFAKSTWKPFPKERMRECVKAYSEEIHSDLWGPGPVETLG